MLIKTTPRMRSAGWAFVAFALTALTGAAAWADGHVVPPMVDETVPVAGSHGPVAKTVETPEFPPLPEIVFLSDTTASMAPAIANVQANASTIMTAVKLGQPTAQFAAAQYRDTGDTPLFQVDAGLTGDIATVNAAIGTWAAAGGGDIPECQMNALNQLALGAAGAWGAPDSTPIIVWFGDSSGHDPCNGAGMNTEVIPNLVANEVTVIAIPVVTDIGDGLDNTGQATAIANATDGSVSAGVPPEQVAQAILDALSNLPVTVVPTPVGCGPLQFTFDPVEQTVTSGDPVNFDETIAVPNDPALAGTSIHCTVEFRDKDTGTVLDVNGEEEGGETIQEIWIDVPIDIDLDPDTDTNELGFDLEHTVTATVTSGPVPIPGRSVSFEVTGTNPEGPTSMGPTDASGQVSFTYAPPVEPASLGDDQIEGCIDSNPDICDTVDKTWVDTTPPIAQCLETVNPHGQKKPQAPGTGQNEDGFYQVSAEDVVWPEESLEIFISGFGPFASGDNVKITEDPIATPESKKMGSGQGQAGAIAAHLILNADAVVTAVDGSGNVSEPVDCLVPPPPK